MTKNEKKDILKKLKKAALVASSVVTGLTVGGCEVSNKKDEAVANNNIVFIDEQTDATTSTIESTETTTTFKPINTDIHRRKYVDGNDSSSDTEYVETSYENDLITSSTTVTSTKNSNDNVVIDDNTTTSKTTTRPASKTSPNTDKTTTNTTKTTKTTHKTTKTTSDTTKTTTSKTTTRPTTSKTTTTVTTTTEAVTEPPVQQDGDRLCVNGYYIQDISNDYVAYMYFQEHLHNELIWKYNCPGIFEADLGYGNTTLSRELSFLIYSCNYKYIYGDSLNFAYFDFDSDALNNSKYFLCNFQDIQDFFEADTKPYQYCIDENDRIFLYNAYNAYKEGWFDSFINDNINNIPDNAGVYAILYSLDHGVHLSYDDVNNKLDNMITNYVPEDILGFSYTK